MGSNWIWTADIPDAGFSGRGSVPVEVVVDDRERASGVIEHLSSLDTVKITVRRLKIGDYLVGNRVLIERKTVQDLSASIIDGRLFKQACGLAGSTYRPVVLIEGHISRENNGGVSRAAIQGAIVTLALFLDMPCLRSLDARESANIIRYAALQMRRNVSHVVYRHGYRPQGRKKRRLFVIQGLPGIGPRRAERLLEAFGTVEGVFHADIETLSRVEGLGRKTAMAIRDLIGPASGPDAP